MNKINGNNRIAWVDMAKGYGIIFVILGHIGFGRFGDWIYSFHLPLFVFVSGYLFKTNCGWKPFITKISKSLLIPYFCFVPVIFICEYYPFSNMTVKDVFDFIIGFVLQKRFKFIWFLLYLFLIELLFYAITILTNNKKVLFTICIILTGLGHIYNLLFSTPLIWNIDAVLFSMLFFCLGFFYRTFVKNYISKNIKIKIVPIIAFSLVINLTCVFLIGNRLELFGALFGIPGISYISAMAGILFIVAVSELVNINAIAYIGRNSLSYYLTHLHISFPISIQILADFGIITADCNTGIRGIAVRFLLFLLAIIVCTTIDYAYKLLRQVVRNIK